MKKYSKLLLLFLSIIVLFYNCKKTDTDPTTTEAGDSLSPEDDEFIASCSISNPTLQQILGSAGAPLARQMRIQGPYGDLMDKMLTDAQGLSGQKILLYRAGADPTLEPEHFGLVYSYGQNDLTNRLNPKAGNDLHKKYSVYGTDCSGLIYNLFSRAGFNIPDFSSADFETKLTAALEKNEKFKTVKLKNLRHIPEQETKSGDFIVWKVKGHMGIIAKLWNLTRIIYQSNGTGYPGSEAQQMKNLGSTRGVHPIDFAKAITTSTDPNKSYWGEGYEIFRLEPNIKELIKAKWLIDKIIDNEYVNGSLVKTNTQTFNNGSYLSFSDNTFIVYNPSEPTQPTCNGTYSLNNDNNEIITMVGCDLSGTHSIESISDKEMVIAGNKSGTTSDYSQSILYLKK